MSAKSAPAVEVHAPRETGELFGHEEAEATLLDAYRTGRIPHAWLIGGPRGIGKATLAYRMARFVLAHPDPNDAAVKTSQSLDVPPEHPAARQVANGSHGGLLALERIVNERGNLGAFITVDQARGTIPFFGSTAAVDGWRICIVDTVDELNANAANALLKVLEEPPSRSLFLLVSNAPSRVMPTIRSRCRKLSLRQLSQANVIKAAAAATGLPDRDQPLIAAAEASEGSVARAIEIMGGNTLALQQQTQTLLDALPSLDERAIHALGDKLPLNDKVSLAAFTDAVERWLSGRLEAQGQELQRLSKLAEAWEKIVHDARETGDYNLERRPLVFSAFHTLAKATR